MSQFYNLSSTEEFNVVTSALYIVKQFLYKRFLSIWSIDISPLYHSLEFVELDLVISSVLLLGYLIIQSGNIPFSYFKSKKQELERNVWQLKF